MKTILLIGGQHLKYFAPAMIEAGYAVLWTKDVKQAIEVLSSDAAFDGVVLPMYINHGGELNPEITGYGIRTGSVLTEMFRGGRPDTKFFLFSSEENPSGQGSPADTNQVVRLGRVMNTSLNEFVTVLNSRVQTAG